MTERFKLRCHFCGSPHVRMSQVSIALTLGGFDYSFCEEGLNGMTADEFWQHFFQCEGYVYPPKLTQWAKDAIGQGINPEVVHRVWGTSATALIYFFLHE